MTDEEIKDIWDHGTLTVDTNVLLDLYRYDQNTVDQILKSLDLFRGRMWLSNQVAEEFFKNRHSTIAKAESKFEQAQSAIRKIQEEFLTSFSESKKEFSQIRVLKDQLIENLESSINAAFKEVREEIRLAQEQYPKYRREDPVLTRIIDLFADRCGPAFDDELKTEALNEAKRRVENKIPPGYKDVGKHGDYFVWKQFLLYAQEKQTDIILVTSDQKEDWWAKNSGRITGLRDELLREFYTFTGRKVLAYRTDRFVEFALRNSEDKSVDESVEDALKEIREVQKLRLLRSTNLLIRISQEETVTDEEKRLGRLKATLVRPVPKFTCSGRLEPKMTGSPNMELRLLQCPPETPAHTISANTGTNFDFNIHIQSTQQGYNLPDGEYIFEYEAVLPQCTPDEQ
ncbi:MAG: PIN domain-containing protein [Cyanobacteria bacterium]|nr:PIN domain-containing protein [Cyanobacteriota bacterium]